MDPNLNDSGRLVTKTDNHYIIKLPIVKFISIKNQLMTQETDENYEKCDKVS